MVYRFMMTGSYQQVTNRQIGLFCTLIAVYCAQARAGQRDKNLPAV